MSTDPQQPLLRKIKVLIVAAREMEEEVAKLQGSEELRTTLLNTSMQLMKFLNQLCIK